jgi:DNA repair protein RadC
MTVSVTAARRCRDAELQADRRYLYLLTGSVGETVTDLSQRLLAQHGGLRGLFRMDITELARLRGLGDAKSVRLIAALELERRLAALPPEDVANLLSIEMAALKQEQLWVVLLDTKHRILGTRTVSQSAAQIST